MGQGQTSCMPSSCHSRRISCSILLFLSSYSLSCIFHFCICSKIPGLMLLYSLRRPHPGTSRKVRSVLQLEAFQKNEHRLLPRLCRWHAQRCYDSTSVTASVLDMCHKALVSLFVAGGQAFLIVTVFR